jgi:hypothetical protein
MLSELLLSCARAEVEREGEGEGEDEGEVGDSSVSLCFGMSHSWPSRPLKLLSRLECRKEKGKYVPVSSADEYRRHEDALFCCDPAEYSGVGESYLMRLVSTRTRVADGFAATKGAASSASSMEREEEGEFKESRVAVGG